MNENIQKKKKSLLLFFAIHKSATLDNLFSDVLAYEPFEPLETFLEGWKKTNTALIKKIQKN